MKTALIYFSALILACSARYPGFGGAAYEGSESLETLLTSRFESASSIDLKSSNQNENNSAGEDNDEIEDIFEDLSSESDYFSSEKTVTNESLNAYYDPKDQTIKISSEVEVSNDAIEEIFEDLSSDSDYLSSEKTVADESLNAYYDPEDQTIKINSEVEVSNNAIEEIFEDLSSDSDYFSSEKTVTDASLNTYYDPEDQSINISTEVDVSNVVREDISEDLSSDSEYFSSEKTVTDESLNAYYNPEDQDEYLLLNLDEILKVIAMLQMSDEGRLLLATLAENSEYYRNNIHKSAEVVASEEVMERVEIEEKDYRFISDEEIYR